ncbi:winged helix-turn-helix transcriptional regulator [Verrucomicrobiaceae bacterium R5-34]|uniref:Winged helix-turn-helix transcriptional regulator n=1 Tax=Oceaniferula flava TaxID=2800421 RepID=A0AAE2SC76_9BACT|nr:metalloregulator ArsR/SmtB family transcription factor [Oceaniferula flavus]MBK1830994.1 winged helix-turn-helix transcriptional regulator [Verrucomicrobiaceae bacterium R5-34]MBK1855511.1 winged helix-turn-helix transcriptional regulator [Oceaniferula flavus]MBM1136817.1 winged helix-turn-helix transcriptional regulator [Oceaniferula flavus]
MPKKKKQQGKLGEEALEAMAATFRVLSEPGRLALIQEVKEGERTVGDLVDETGLAQASVSKHLKILFDAGLLNRRKEGVKVYYSVKGDFVYSLCRMVCQKLDEEQRGRGEIDFVI